MRKKREKKIKKSPEKVRLIIFWFLVGYIILIPISIFGIIITILSPDKGAVFSWILFIGLPLAFIFSIIYLRKYKFNAVPLISLILSSLILFLELFFALLNY